MQKQESDTGNERRARMSDRCFSCKHAEWDYFEYYGTNRKDWFVEGCKKCHDIDTEDCDNCEDYEEKKEVQADE